MKDNMSREKLFIGVDLSMRSPGVSCLREDGSIKWLRFFSDKAKLQGSLTSILAGLIYPIYSCDQERFHLIGTAILDLIKAEIDNGYDVRVALEGYSYGSTASRLFQIAENGGHFKYLCWANGIDVDIVAPTSVKKLATGKGNAKKELVYSAFAEKYGVDLHKDLGTKSEKIGSPESDIADSVWMAEWKRLKDLG